MITVILDFLGTVNGLVSYQAMPLPHGIIPAPQDGLSSPPRWGRFFRARYFFLFWIAASL
jgi:hypothetical protein